MFWVTGNTYMYIPDGNFGIPVVVKGLYILPQVGQLAELNLRVLPASRYSQTTYRLLAAV